MHKLAILPLLLVLAIQAHAADDIRMADGLTVAYAVRTLADGRTIMVGGRPSSIAYQYRLTRVEFTADGSVGTVTTWPIDCSYEPADIAILDDGGLAAAGTLYLVAGDEVTVYSYLHVDAHGTATLRDLHPGNQVWRGFVADRQRGLVVAYSGRPGAQEHFLVADFRPAEPVLRPFVVADDQVVLYSAALHDDTVVLSGTYVGGLQAMVIAVRGSDVLWANTYGSGYPDPSVIVWTSNNTLLHVHGRQTDSRDLVMTHLLADGSVINASTLTAPGYQLVTSAEAGGGRVVIGGMSEREPIVISANDDGTEARMDLWSTVGLEHIVEGVTRSADGTICAVSRSAPADPGLINGSRAATVFRGADVPAALDAPCRGPVPAAAQTTTTVGAVSRMVVSGAPPLTGTAVVTIPATTSVITADTRCSDVSSPVSRSARSAMTIDQRGSDLRITGIDGPTTVRLVSILGTVAAERMMTSDADGGWAIDHLPRGTYVVVVSGPMGPVAVQPITVGF